MVRIYTGNAAQQQLRGARYIFEGTVTEANAGADQHQSGVSIGGLRSEAAKTRTRLQSSSHPRRQYRRRPGLGERQQGVERHSVGIGGTAAFASPVASMSGRNVNPMTPDVNYQSSHRESVDKALRACIETSVLALIKRTDLSAN